MYYSAYLLPEGLGNHPGRNELEPVLICLGTLVENHWLRNNALASCCS